MWKRSPHRELTQMADHGRGDLKRYTVIYFEMNESGAEEEAFCWKELVLQGKF